MTVVDDANIAVVPFPPVQQSVLYFPAGNDVQVHVQYPSVSDGTGCQSEFYYKIDRTMSDTDPTTIVYTTLVVDDPDNSGATMSTFTIDAEDNATAGSMWWRVDFVDSAGLRTTVGFGTLLVEAV